MVLNRREHAGAEIFNAHAIFGQRAENPGE
jgi:hypothetical protein